ncbi:hypothetical protein GJ496_011644 [Pomphorhynchus laevis]|nr:hypothetical protein GJ496_011644 [Pomphorhynchus laevis]
MSITSQSWLTSILPGLTGKLSSFVDSYIDDIIIDTTKVDPEYVVAAFKKFGLTSKPIEQLEVDVSSLAIGLFVEIINTIVEDASWLRAQDGSKLISISKLEAVLKGIKMDVRWYLQFIKLFTESSTVDSWCDPHYSTLNQLDVEECRNF